MQTRPILVLSVIAMCSAQLLAQLGPVPSDEPLGRRASTQSAPASAAIVHDKPDSPLTLDEMLISRSIDREPVSGSASDQRPLGRSSDSLPLRSADASTETVEGASVGSNRLMSRGGMAQTGIALAGVLLLILGLGQLYKKLARSQGGLAGAIGAGGSAPSGLVEILGRYPISSKMTLVVMRFDRRVLLLSHAGGGRGRNSQLGAMTTLCELDRAEDVASVLLKVRNEEGDSIAQSFERTLREADEYQDRMLEDAEYGYEHTPVRVPTRTRQPTQVMSNDAGDRAEFGVATESEAAAGVLRRRLAAMRPRSASGQQVPNQYRDQFNGGHQ